MKLAEKALLSSWVKSYIAKGCSKSETIKYVSGLGFNRRTVGKYYDAFKP